MPLDFEKLSPQELLAAESAVLTMRSLLDAVQTAPHGQGMAHVESVLYDKGFDHLRNLLATAAASHDGARKRGPAVWPVRAGRRPRSGGAAPSRS